MVEATADKEKEEQKADEADEHEDNDEKKREKNKERKSKDDKKRGRKHSKRSRSRSRDKRKEREVDRDRDRDRNRDRDRDKDRDRIRDRDKRRRSRSRSRSRDRRRKRSHSRDRRRSRSFSRSFSPRRRKNFRKPVAVPEGPGGTKMFWDGYQWSTNSALAQSAAAKQPQMQQQTRKDRRLYVDNLPKGVGLQSTQLEDFINSAMHTNGFADPGQPGNPVQSVFIGPEGTYAFVEFRSVAEAANALSLTGLVLLGQPLRVSRPSNYTPAGGMELMGTMGGMMGGATVASMAFAPNDNATTILLMMGMITAEDLQEEEDFEDICDEVKEECEKVGGAVKKVTIPRNAENAGKVFVEFESLQGARSAQAALHGRKFDGRPVNVMFTVPEEVVNAGI